MDYKPYSMEWTRKRYLSEAIQQYFDTDAPVYVILDDIVDVLEQNASLYRSRAEKFQSVLNALKNLPLENQKSDNTPNDGIYKQEDNSEVPWSGYVPGSSEASERGCKCPIVENQNMPSNIKWIAVDCPIHGKKLETKWELNNSPLKWNNEYRFVPAPPQDDNVIVDDSTH